MNVTRVHVRIGREVSLGVALFGLSLLPLTPATGQPANELRKQGDALFRAGQPRAARSRYLRALRDARPYNAIDIHDRLGWVAMATADPFRALEHFASAAQLTRQHLGARHSRVATSLINIARVLEDMDRPRMALRALERATAALVAHHGSRHITVAVARNNLAHLYLKLHRPDKALELFSRVLPVYEAARGNRPGLIASVHAGRCESLLHLERSDRARDACNRALATSTGPHRAERAQHGAALLLLARLDWQTTPDHDGNVNQFAQGLDLIDTHGTPRARIAARHGIARHLRKQNEFAAASAMYARAAGLVLRYRDGLTRGRSEFHKPFAPLFEEWLDLELRRDAVDRAFAVESLRKGLAISEALRMKSRASSIQTATVTPMRELRRAIDRTHARVIALRAFGGEGLAGATDELIKFEEQLEALKASTAGATDATRSLADTRSRLLAMQRDLSPNEAVIAYVLRGPAAPGAFILTREEPVRFLRLPGRTETIGITARNLHTLFSGPEFDPRLLCPCDWVRRPDDLRLILDHTREGGNLRVNGRRVFRQSEPFTPWFALMGGRDVPRPLWSDGLLPPDDPTLLEGTLLNEPFDDDKVGALRARLGRELSGLILRPLWPYLKKKRHWIVIPEGTLNYVPFSVLPDADGQPLARRVSIREMHSATALAMLRSRPPSPARRPFLGVGHPVYARPHSLLAAATPGQVFANHGWSNLPATEREVRALADLAYAKARTDEHILLGPRASRVELLRRNEDGRLRGYRTLHFSVHGFLSDANPEFNALVLSRPDLVDLRNPGKDARASGDIPGVVRYREFRAFDLDAELVALSACQSSPGAEVSGEGMVALPQAFLIAGSRRVLATLWPVPAGPTRDFFVAFYRRLWVDRLPHHEALRRARLELSRSYPDPYFWAGFVLFGP